MIVAGRASVFAAVMIAVLLLAAAVQPAFLVIAGVGNVLVLVLALTQGWRLSGNKVAVSREKWDYLSLNREQQLIYRLENRGAGEALVGIRQPLPPSIRAEDNTLLVAVGPGEVVEVALDVRPITRGPAQIPPAQVDIKSPSVDWASWRYTMEEPADVTIFPDTKSLAEYDTLRHHRALGRFGVHRMRQIGAGWEFEHLREYTPDDDYRNINWKSTARRRTPITNVFQAEKSQNVLLCVECGRMMGAPMGEGIALDKAIDASIMLAHVANRNADKVGLAVFKDTVDLYLKPKKGVIATQRIVEGLVGLAPEGVFPSYSALVDTLRAKNKTRSMVFLFTDISDPKLADDLCRVLPLVSRRHVVVVVSLFDPTLAQVAGGGADNMRGVYRVLAARKLLSEREGRLMDLRRRGVQVLEAPAEALTLAVINRYMEIKNRQLL
ncbi:MAG: DUF58 domain-containing protein [Nitrospinota bacterium]|nr:DUF58 domain-containing protein [Nitrospinota bacterium]